MFRRTGLLTATLLLSSCFILCGCGSAENDYCPAGEMRRDANCLKVCNDSTMCEEGEVCFSGLCMDPGVGTCGDGVLNKGEGCDNGANNSDTGACTTSCRQATCGDGLLQDSVEQCDDGNATDETECEYGTET